MLARNEIEIGVVGDSAAGRFKSFLRKVILRAWLQDVFNGRVRVGDDISAENFEAMVHPIMLAT